MKFDEKKKQLCTQERLSVLWIVVMFTMAFADILTFVLPEALNDLIKGTADVKITQELLLVMAVFVQIPIIMIYLSRVLDYRMNRWVNIIASVITIIFVIAGGSLYLHYIFFAFVEIIFMLLIIWHSLKWKADEMNN